MNLCCPVSGTWTVAFTAGDDPAQVTGTCDRCLSLLSFTPSDRAVQLARLRLTAAREAMAQVADAPPARAAMARVAGAPRA